MHPAWLVSVLDYLSIHPSICPSILSVSVVGCVLFLSTLQRGWRHPRRHAVSQLSPHLRHGHGAGEGGGAPWEKGKQRREPLAPREASSCAVILGSLALGTVTGAPQGPACPKGDAHTCLSGCRRELPGAGFSANQLERQENKISKSTQVLLGSWDDFQPGCHSIPVSPPGTSKTRLSPECPWLLREHGR